MRAKCIREWVEKEGFNAINSMRNARMIVLCRQADAISFNAINSMRNARSVQTETPSQADSFNAINSMRNARATT